MRARSSGVRPVVLAAMAAAAALYAVQLLLPPIVGLANNGDFERVLGPVGLRAAAEGRAEKYFSWIVRRFQEANDLRVDGIVDPQTQRALQDSVQKTAQW